MSARTEVHAIYRLLDDPDPIREHFSTLIGSITELGFTVAPEQDLGVNIVHGAERARLENKLSQDQVSSLPERVAEIARAQRLPDQTFVEIVGAHAQTGKIFLDVIDDRTDTLNKDRLRILEGLTRIFGIKFGNRNRIEIHGIRMADITRNPGDTIGAYVKLNELLRNVIWPKRYLQVGRIAVALTTKEE